MNVAKFDLKSCGHVTKHFERAVKPGHYSNADINNDKTDDRLENYQLLSGVDNRRKENALRPPKEMVDCICPVCGKEFQIEKRNFKFKNNPCCSRKCGGIKSHWK